MPKQVWKCTHCDASNSDKEKVIIHEKKCRFNPANKTCWTCGNYERDGLFEWWCVKDESMTQNKTTKGLKGKCSDWVLCDNDRFKK